MMSTPDLHQTDTCATEQSCFPNKDLLALGWTDVGRFAEAITFARKALMSPAKELIDKYPLGPRGIWLIGLIASGRVKTQSDFGKLYGIGKSMVTEQIALLVEQGLIVSTQSDTDRRQKVLSLTKSGQSLNNQLGEAFTAKIQERIGHYSNEDLNFCIKLLNDLAGPARFSK